MTTGPALALALALGIVGGSARQAAAQVPAAASRADLLLDEGWEYLERGAADPRALDTIPRAAWMPVALPHTWNALDATDPVPGYRRDAGWYRRTLSPAETQRAAGERVLLAFEGANTVADVFVDGTRAGGHVGGYVPFVVDLTPHLRAGAANELLVRVDNADRPELIPSHRSDFAIYGGLTRDVRLQRRPAVAISGIAVRTPEVSRTRARAVLTVTLRNPERAGGRRTLDATLLDPHGRPAARRTVTASLTGDTTQRVELDLPAVRSPSLWSPSSPALYRAVVRLSPAGDANAGADSADARLGFRFYRFAANGPFYLNGERLLLRGTHRHEEWAGLGAAVPDSLHRRDMAMIKAMGANFVRLAHYPQDPAVYRAADSLGLLLWDELPWDRGGLGDERWRAHTRRLLREQIAANANHPSIILWSLANEPADLVEAPNGGDPDSLRAFLGELAAIVRELDPARPTAMRKFDAGADVVDVYSPSIWAGWYRGVYRGYERALAEAHARFPRLLHMEFGGDAHVGRHTETPISGEGLRIEPGYEERVGTPVANIAREGDWSESYQTDLLDWHLMVSERQPWLAGTAQWVFKDFATPLRPENPIPFVNQKGLVTRDGRPKDAYYVFRSYWTTTPAFVYIVSHSWTERAGRAGAPHTVRAYSNCDSVSLSLNGAELGARRRLRDDFPSQGLRWTVTFAPGENRLTARCADGSAADSLAVRYHDVVPGRPADLRLSSRRLDDGKLLVEAVLVDRAGNRSLDAADRIYFDHSGDGSLLADRGTPTGSRVIEAADGRAAIELVPPPPGGRSVIVARTQELNGARLIIDGAPPPRASAPRR